MRRHCPDCGREQNVMVDFTDGEWCSVCERPLNRRAETVTSRELDEAIDREATNR